MKVVALICARGGTKGLPGKNLRALAGKPLIGWAIEQARAVSTIERVVVSTDSIEIAETAKRWGAQVPFMRPRELAGDHSPEWGVWQHALSFLKKFDGCEPDVLVVVPTTAPLRLPSDIERCLDELQTSKSDVVITVTQAHRNPYFNMVHKISDNTVELVLPQDQIVARRQDAPEVFDITTVAYAMRADFVLSSKKIFDGRVSSVLIPSERAIDIDTALDFEIAEMLMMKSLQSYGEKLE